jgi:hypothetical protein
MPTVLSLIADRQLPLAGDPRQAELLLAQAGETRLAELVADAPGQRVLESVFGNSPFLARCTLGDPDFALELFASDPESLFNTLI